jgi:hypothetical protein
MNYCESMSKITTSQIIIQIIIVIYEAEASAITICINFYQNYQSLLEKSTNEINLGNEKKQKDLNS